MKSLYAAFERKDVEATRRILHPDVEWIQCAGFPGGGSRRGAEQVIEKVFGGLASAWRGFRADVEEYLDAGDEVVALGRYSGTHSVTGKSMVAVFAHVYSVSDGRIVRYRQYADTAEIVKAGVNG